MTSLKTMMANLITDFRIVFSLIMLCFPVFSSGFYACYFMAGVTDMVDGVLARKLGTSSETGERLDTIADMVFVATALYKILPAVKFSREIWIWTGIIAVIKVINSILGFVMQKKFVAVHSWANKITGLMLFILPYSFPVIDIRYSAVAVCVLATFAALQEGHIIRSQIV